MFVLLAAISFTGFASAQTVLPDSERIHFGDLIEIDVVGNFDFDWRGRLSPEGFLEDFDKISEPVFARCLTTAELSAAVVEQYSKILRDPKVEVSILDRSNRALAYLDGAVKTPQRLRLKRDLLLNELLIVSGGIIDTANGEITIFRPANLSCEAGGTAKSGEPATLRIRIADLLSGDKASNPKIFSGDIVTVVESLPIYMIGGVNSPRPISSRTELSLSRAVAIAGGVAKDGVSQSVTIFRRENAGTKAIEADLDQIADGKADDPILRPYDIVEVNQKGRSKRRFPPVIDDRGNRSSRLSAAPLRVID